MDELVDAGEVWVPVRLIERRGPSALWEYDDGTRLRRVLLPGEIVPVEGAFLQELLAEGLEVGEPWEDLLRLTLTPAEAAAEWRRQGIWTAEDLRRDVVRARKVLERRLGQDLTEMLHKLR